jgi:hypothetical protein
MKLVHVVLRLRGGVSGLEGVRGGLLFLSTAAILMRSPDVSITQRGETYMIVVDGDTQVPVRDVRLKCAQLSLS